MFDGVSEDIWSINVSDDDAHPEDLSQASSDNEDQALNEVLNHYGIKQKILNILSYEREEV